MMDDRDTIFALSSGRPPAAIAVIRVSGPRAGAALKALTGKIPAPRLATLGRLRRPQSKEIIDEALVLWFPGPRSETGEDMTELQVHGGRAVIAAVLQALSGIAGLRPAEAGEFTRRAFENGKLDLTAVEGLADLVMAETETQRRQAFLHHKGLLGDCVEGWRQKLIQALALTEAAIDFCDEGDVPGDVIEPALAVARELHDEIGAALADGGRGERLRDGLVVAIAGPPNAGKSTLLNRIAKREVAIVSPVAGTTRDVIEVHLDLGGLPVTLLDTAGIRGTEDPVELAGVRRARERAAAADLVLWLEDSTGPLAESRKKLDASKVWLVRTKVDLLADRNESETTRSGKNEPRSNPNGRLKDIADKELVSKSEPKFNKHELEFSISAVSGVGFDHLLSVLSCYAENHLNGAESALITRERHRRALLDTQAALDQVLELAAANQQELIAEELRRAARALARLVGRVDVEDILDVIFRDFCIGK
jgi:tRNA modification GTPase